MKTYESKKILKHTNGSVPSRKLIVRLLIIFYY